MVRGSGCAKPSGGPSRPRRPNPVRPATAARPVRWGSDGRVGRPPRVDDPECSWPRSPCRPYRPGMQLITPYRPQPHSGSLIAGTMLGALPRRVRPGPRVRRARHPGRRRPRPRSCGRPRPPSGPRSWSGRWSSSPGACPPVGRDQPAGRGRGDGPGPPPAPLAGRRGARIAAGRRDRGDRCRARPTGRPIPELVIGPFGVAVIHELGRREAIRQVGTSWERKTREGWLPTEHPLDAAERDAERVRHWLTTGDLDFVVRVHAALITADPSMLRSPLCAVITEAQIPDWIAALPRQRTLTEGRRQQIVARVRGAVATDGAASPQRGW